LTQRSTATTAETRRRSACWGAKPTGGFATYVAVAATHAHDVADSPLSDEQLACLPVAYGAAIGMLERAALRAGETVLVTGASGGVGLALVQLAAARGADVVAVSSSAKASALTDAGATQVVSRDVGDLAEQVTTVVPTGLDAVADVVGARSAGVSANARTATALLGMGTLACVALTWSREATSTGRRRGRSPPMKCGASGQAHS
jgi:NADPH:quinone reductase-like Zn-dependent oxidoreductase